MSSKKAIKQYVNKLQPMYKLKVESYPIKQTEKAESPRKMRGIKNGILMFVFSIVFGSFFLNIQSAHAAYRNIIEAEPTLLYYWPMDDAAGTTTLNAAVGGTAINLTGATAGTSGQVDGTAVSFNGTSNFGATAATLNLTAYNKIVVEALVYFNSYDTTYRQAWELGPNAITTGLGFAYDGGVGGPTAQSNVFLNGNTGYNLALYNRPSVAAWHQVVAVYNKGLSSNEVDLYIDGALQTASSRPNNADNTNNFGNQLFYLMSRDGNSFYGDGKMQHLAIYSDLSSAAILAHAQAAGLLNLTAGTLSDSSVSTTTASLSWTSAINGSAPITTQLQRSAHGAGAWSNVTSAMTSPAIDTGLSSQTSYDYRVTYTDATSAVVYSNIVTITTKRIYPPFTGNSQLAIVGPYDTPAIGSANWGPPGGQTSIDILSLGQIYRIRQNGTITAAQFYTATTTGLTGFYITIYRLNGTTYTLVGKSNNLASQLVAGTTTTITFSSPITGVQEGDYYGMRIEASGGSGATDFVARTSQTNASSSYVSDLSSPPATTTWSGGGYNTSSGSVMPIDLYMTPAPQVVFTGDSIIEGYPNNISFVDSTHGSNVSLPTTIEDQFGYLTGYTFQNMGIGGERTDQIAARFTSDVLNLHPRIAVLEGGVNDIGQSYSEANFLASWTSMLTAAQADSDITTILVLKILPWSNGTNTQMQERDQWNNDLATLAAGYSKAIVVDASSYVGQFRSGGTAGNLWDIQPAYNQGGVHFTQSGYGQIAQALADALFPTITTTVATGVSTSTVFLNGSIIATGGASVTQSGFAYGTDPNLINAVSTSTLGAQTGTATLVQNLTGLTASTTYYYQAYTVNSAGASTGSIQSFTTLSNSTVISPTITPPAPVVYSRGGGGGGGFSSPSVTASALSKILAPSASATAYINSLLTSTTSFRCPAGWVCTPNSAASEATTTFTRNLWLGISGNEVKALQQYLNGSGNIVATTGAGSPGNESTYFGTRTQMALIKFQKAHGIPATGFFGAISRGYILTH